MRSWKPGRGTRSLVASRLEPNEWYLGIEGELMADSILNKMATEARRIDLDGPNMREYFAKRRKPHRCQGSLLAVPPVVDRRYRSS